jgi:hypothetical protein
LGIVAIALFSVNVAYFSHCLNPSEALQIKRGDGLPRISVYKCNSSEKISTKNVICGRPFVFYTPKQIRSTETPACELPRITGELNIKWQTLTLFGWYGQFPWNCPSEQLYIVRDITWNSFSIYVGGGVSAKCKSAVYFDIIGNCVSDILDRCDNLLLIVIKLLFMTGMKLPKSLSISPATYSHGLSDITRVL